MPRKAKDAEILDAEEDDQPSYPEPETIRRVNLAQAEREGEVQFAAVQFEAEQVLLLLCCVIVARMALYLTIEGRGRSALVEAIVANVIFGLAGLACFGRWALLEWRATGWLTVGKGSLIVAGFLMLLDALVSGLWVGEFRAGHNALGPAIGLFVLLLLIAAGLIEQVTQNGLKLLRRFSCSEKS